MMTPGEPVGRLAGPLLCWGHHARAERAGRAAPRTGPPMMSEPGPGTDPPRLRPRDAGLQVLVAVETIVSEHELALGVADRSGTLPDRLTRVLAHYQRAVEVAA